jgi:hypothetical protein
MRAARHCARHSRVSGANNGVRCGARRPRDSCGLGRSTSAGSWALIDTGTESGLEPLGGARQNPLGQSGRRAGELPSGRGERGTCRGCRPEGRHYSCRVSGGCLVFEAAATSFSRSTQSALNPLERVRSRGREAQPARWARRLVTLVSWANCSPLTPLTKCPPRTRPRASKRRSAQRISRHGTASRSWR